MKYLVIIEKNKQGHYGAYVPDLPSCISIGDTEEEVKINIKEAIQLHVEGLKAEGYEIPAPSARALSVAV